MTAKIIDGKAIAAEFNAETRELAFRVAGEFYRQPGLAVVLVGDDPASQVYVRNKIRTSAETGIRSELHRLPATATTAEVLELVARLNADPAVDGILVQSPPPPQVDEAEVIRAIDPDKDVDCFSERNVGRLLIGHDSGFRPCTPWGVMELLRRSGCDPAGKHAVVVGRSNIVGKPMAALLMQKAAGANATVTVVHSGTVEPERYARQADILIAAIGRPNFVTGNWIKPGAVVIDVGINRVVDPDTGRSRLTGDVNFDEAVEIASAITPVPGGVGPMTVAVLMRNAVTAAMLHLRMCR